MCANNPESNNQPTDPPNISEAMQTPTIGELAGALAKAQGEIQQAHSDKENPFFKSKYADLASNWDACRAPLSKNGLAVIQTTTENNEGKITVITTLAHSSGEFIKGKLTLKPEKNTPQGIGSAFTYARRYALAAIVGIAPADDDGEGGMDRTPGATPKNTKPAPKNNEAKTQLDSTKKEFISLFAKLKKLPSGKYDKKWVDGLLQKEFGVDSIWKCKAGELEKMQVVYKQLQETLNNHPKSEEKEFSETTDLHKKIRKYAAKVKELNSTFGANWLATQCGRFGGSAPEEITDMKSLEELLGVIEAKGKELNAAQ